MRLIKITLIKIYFQKKIFSQSTPLLLKIKLKYKVWADLEINITLYMRFNENTRTKILIHKITKLTKKLPKM